MRKIKGSGFYSGSLFEGSYCIEHQGIGSIAESMLPKTDWQPPASFPDLSSSKVIAIDLETKDPFLRKRGPGFLRGDANITGVAIATDYGYSEYFPVRHEGGGNLAPNVVFSWLKEVLALPVPKIGANLSYELEGLWSEGVKVAGDCIDVLSAEAVIDEEKQRDFKKIGYSEDDEIGYSLNAVAKKYLGETKNETLLKQIQSTLGVKDIKGLLYKLPARYVAEYAKTDVKLPIAIWQLQREELARQELLDIFQLETDLLPLLLAMRVRGVRVDINRAEQVRTELREEIKKNQNEIKRLTGKEVDVWAPTDLSALCDRIGITYNRTKPTEKAPEGNPSFTQEWLSSSEHPVLKIVADIRKTEKMVRDFVEGFVLNMSHNGRLHPQFHPLRRDEDGTRSGRFSSTNPNCQQIPGRDERFTALIRGLFIPEHGCEWGCADYSSQEPRLTVHYAYLAKLAGAEEAWRAYNTNPRTDYHQMVADMANIKRKLAKIINLGLAYGMGKRKLSLNLGFMTQAQFEDPSFPIPQEAEELFRLYHEKVPYVRALGELCTNLAQQRGWIKTVLGRKRHFELWEPKKVRSEDWAGGRIALPLAIAQQYWQGKPLQRAYTHKALNALIQGSAADQTKKAMLDLWRAGYVPHLTVHDEINDSITSGKHAKEMVEIMVNAVHLSVPTVVDIGVAKNWGASDCKAAFARAEELMRMAA